MAADLSPNLGHHNTIMITTTSVEDFVASFWKLL
jgi:hypothetical protein